MLQTEPRAPKESWLDRPLLAAIHLDWEKALYALFVLLAAISRLWDLGARVMSHDETVHIQWSWYLFQGRGYSHTPLSHGPFLFHATALSYYLFGDNDFSARLVVALLGIVLVALPYVFRRWIGRTGALVTSFLFLISPSLLYYSRYIRHDIPIIVWSLVAIAAVFYYLDESIRKGNRSFSEEPLVFRNGRTRWLMILAGAVSLMYATKEVAFIYIATIGLFLVILFFARLGTPTWRSDHLARYGRWLLYAAAILLLLSALTYSLSLVVAAPDTGADPTAEVVPDATTISAAEVLQGIARISVGGAVLLLAGFVAILAIGSPSHQRIVLTVTSLVVFIGIIMVLFLFTLSTIELFPIHYRECGQAPVPGTKPGEMSCSESDCEVIQGRCQRPIPIVAGRAVLEFDESGARVAIGLSQIEILFAVVLIALATLMAGASTYAVLNRFLPFRGGERPALDLIVLIGSFTLPMLAPFGITGLSRILSRLFFGIDAGFSAMDYSEAGLLRSAGFVFILLGVSVVVGLKWDWRRWLLAAAVFYVIFVVLYTTVFTNGNGLASGTVGSLAYWLEQQDVQRGSQPPYYYGLLVPLYEYLPLVGFLGAAVYVLLKGLRSSEKVSTAQPDTPSNDVFAMHVRQGDSADEPLAPAPEPAPEENAPSSEDSGSALSKETGRTFSLESAFVLFLLFWTAMTWVAYSAAGEKMPWLTTHFAVPMAMATGWGVGKLIDSIEWGSVLRRGGWLLIPIGLVGFAALVQTISPWFAAEGTQRPFSGYGLGQLNSTMQFLSALAVLAVCVGALYWLWRRVGAATVARTIAVILIGVLMVLTIRTAWNFAYVNEDYATEYLVYAHASPDVREVMEQIEDISRRTSGDLSLDVAYTADGSYPFIWYLRNYRNATQLPNPPSRPDLEKPVIIAGDQEWAGIEPYLGENFVCNHYDFLWWPMQDYYNLNWDRIRFALTDPQMRSALWDIIFRRDYQKYEQATGKVVRPSQWPLRDQFRLCIRNDVLAQVWDGTAGPPDFVPEITESGSELLDYAGLEQAPAAELVVSSLGPAGSFSGPHGLAADAEGVIYVADSDNHRIVKLSPDGQVLDTWDSTWWQNVQNWKPGCLGSADEPLSLADGEFCEPWGVTVGPDGNVYVADTWNHRIQVFTPAGEFLGKFGVFGQSGSDVSSNPSQFYGPRDVTVNSNGDIYVTDTGNKRIQVFDQNFNFRSAFGGPGIIEGRLDEPVGLDIGPDNSLYVADTWNNRIQVFSLDGLFLREWPIAGWTSQSVSNKPYLTTDSDGRVFVSDPEGARVLVFDSQGEPLAVLGGLNSTLYDLPSGVVVDSSDHLWVSDAANQRVLRFPALQLDQPDEAP
jgi:uncharacterized protein (TIGR03663 family)